MKTLVPNFFGMTNEIFFKYLLIFYLAVIIIGIFLGAYKKISVYEDFNDLGVTLLLFILPLISFLLLLTYGFKIEQWIWVMLGSVVLALFVISVRYSFKGNSNVFTSLYSIAVKIPLAILFVLLVVELFVPGTVRKKRGESKGILLLVLLVFTPILLSLIKEKKGVFSPRFLMSRTRINY